MGKGGGGGAEGKQHSLKDSKDGEAKRYSISKGKLTQERGIERE